MISLSHISQNVMEYITGKTFRKFHSRIRAVDLRHIMLLMPFIIQDLFVNEVQKWNTKHPGNQVRDPSNELVDILCEYIEWYQCFRQREHTTESIVELKQRGMTLVRKCDEVFPRTKTVKGEMI